MDKFITTDQISSMMNHFPNDAAKKNAFDQLVKAGYKIQGYNDQQKSETAKPQNSVDAYIASQGSFREQKTKINNGESGAVESAFSGKPFFPAKKSDTDMSDPNFNPLKNAGKMAGNAISDLPSIVKGAADFVVHPLDSLKGMAQYYAGIASEAFGAIAESAQTGNFTRIQEDLQKATVAMIDHPLQTIAAYEGARGGLNVLKDPKATVTKVVDTLTNTIDKSKLAFNAAKDQLKDKGISFTTDSALHRKTLAVAENIGNQVEKQKTISDLQKEIDSMTEKTSNKVKGKDQEIQDKSLVKTQKELELKRAKDELSDMKKIQKQQVMQASDETIGDLSTNSFSSLRTLQEGVINFFNMAKEKIGKGYEENLGNAKINLDSVFSGLNKFQDYLRGISDKKTLAAIQPFIENLKMRDVITKFGDDTQNLYKELSKQGISPKLWEHLTEEGLKSEYPPLTSENIKGTKHTLEESIRENNTDALKNYNSNVSIAFKESFRDAIKAEYGEDTLKKLDETDKSWSELMSNPLFGKDNISLADIQKNWDSFKKNAEKFPEGKDLMEKIQNYAGEQILTKAKQASGIFNVNTINNGLKQFGAILGEDVKNKLQGVIDLHNSISDVTEKVSDSVDKKKEEVSTTSKELKDLEQEQKKFVKDAKDIGGTPNEVIKNIKEIKSMDELNTFLESSGKSIDEVRSVIMQAIIEKADPRLFEDKSVPFDVEKTPQIIEELKNLGKSEDGTAWKTVNDELLGEKGKKAVKDLENTYKEYESLKKAKGKSYATRILEGAFGTLLVAFGHKIWGGLEIYRAARGNKKPKEVVSGRDRPTPTNKSNTGSTRKLPSEKKIKKAAVVGGINAASEQNQNSEGE